MESETEKERKRGGWHVQHHFDFTVLIFQNRPEKFVFSAYRNDNILIKLSCTFETNIV